MRKNHSVEFLINESLAKKPVKSAKKRRKTSTSTETNPIVVEDCGKGDEEEEDDPYEVKDESFRYVSKAEYDTSCRVSLHGSIHFDFQRFEQISRRASHTTRVGRPLDYYQHEPVAIFDAIAIATNLEAAARRAGSQIPYERLVIMENNDAARIIEQVGSDGSMLAEVKSSAEEFLFALMAVENATRHPPTHIKDLLMSTRVK